MIFLGDVAFPHDQLTFPEIPESEVCCFNCEGYLVSKSSDSCPGVFNNITAISKLPFQQLIGVIANNHISDKTDGIHISEALASEAGLVLAGGGQNLEAASKPVVVKENKNEVAVVAAGWRVIGCKAAGDSQEGVMPLDFGAIKAKIAQLKSSGLKVVLFLHWGYELERYPHPAHRKFAHDCVDYGADLIIGCHAHCLQGYEFYKGRYIFYGLGNAVFAQGYYFNGRLKFPEYCSRGLCVNWDIAKNLVTVSDVSLTNSEVILTKFVNPKNNPELQKYSKFSGMSHEAYFYFFKKYRLKRKGLPIFYENDKSIMYLIKERFVMLRSRILGIAFKLNLNNYKK